MRSTATKDRKTRRASQPTWDVARLFPEEGEWTEADYFELPDNNHLVELADGFLEFPPMPTTSHQWIVALLFEALKAFAWPTIGTALPAPLPLRLWPGRIREPDVVFMLNKNKSRIGEEFWEGADLVMEVVSPGKKSRERDLVTKKRDYAKALINEYWILDPKTRQVTVLHLKGKKYETAGVYKKGTRATSVLLPGFSVEVDALFSA